MSRYGSMHWRFPSSGLRAHPLVFDDPLAVRASKWAKHPYEQLDFTFVVQMSVAAKSSVVHVFSGVEGFMVPDDVLQFSHVPKDAADRFGGELQLRPVNSLQEWDAAVDRLLEDVGGLPSAEAALQTPPAVIHLWGHFKHSQHREAVQVFLAYELLMNSRRLVSEGAGQSLDTHCEKQSEVAFLREKWPWAYLSVTQLERAHVQWLKFLHSEMIEEEIRFTCVQGQKPKRIVVYCRGLSHKEVPLEWFPDSLVVVFGSNRGFGATGLLPDAGWDTPQMLDPNDAAVRHLLETWRDALHHAGVFQPLSDTAVAGFSRYRVLLQHAHFRPPHSFIRQLLLRRLSLLLALMTKVGAANSHLILIGESAGTHLLHSVNEALNQLEWIPHRVVVSAFCMPAWMLADLQRYATEEWTFLVHSEDGWCWMRSEECGSWQWLRQQGAKVVSMDLKFPQLDERVYGRKRHDLFTPLMRSVRFKFWLFGDVEELTLSPLSDAASAALLLTILYGSVWILRCSQSLTTGFLERAMFEPFAKHIASKLFKDAECVNSAAIDEQCLPLWRLFREMPGLAGVWDETMLRNLGQRFAPFLLWFLVHWCTKDVASSCSSGLDRWLELENADEVWWEWFRAADLGRFSTYVIRNHTSFWARWCGSVGSSSKGRGSSDSIVAVPYKSSFVPCELLQFFSLNRASSQGS